MRNLTRAALWTATFSAITQSASALETVLPQDPLWKNAACRNPVLTRTVITDRINGHVSALFDIAQDGTVTNIRILESHPNDLMNYSVSEALADWHYHAYLKDGQEAARKNVPVTFTFGSDQTLSCTHSPLSSHPSTLGDKSDPFQSLRTCPKLMPPKRTIRKKGRVKVSFEFDVSTEGDVLNVRQIGETANDLFAEEAASALKRWKYFEFLEKGTPVSRPGLRIDIHFGDQPANTPEHRCAFAPWGAKKKTFDIKVRRTQLLKDSYASDN